MKLTVKSQVTIPKKIRQVIGVEPGNEVEFEVIKGNMVVLRRKKGKLNSWIGYSGKSTAAEVDGHIRELRGRK